MGWSELHSKLWKAIPKTTITPGASTYKKTWWNEEWGQKLREMKLELSLVRAVIKDYTNWREKKEEYKATIKRH